jgi:outer membrane receptor protein involved in Fe transport
VRYNAAYPVDSGVYKATACLGDTAVEVEACVGDYMLADVNLGFELPGFPTATVQLSVQNLFNDGYRSFPGVPTIGRMAMLRLRYDLN